MPGACADPWSGYGACGWWSIPLLWQWMDWIVRGDVILLGVMLVGVVTIAIHVSYRLRQGRDLTDGRVRRQLAADLGVEVAIVKSIVVAAPYAGLAGACFGTINAFTGIGIEAESGFAAIAPRLQLSFVTTWIGLIVAIAAACFNSRLANRIGSLRVECDSEETKERELLRLTPKFPLKKRLSGMPMYALFAASTFACLIVACSPYVDPQLATGFPVDLAPVSCSVGHRQIVLHVTDGGELLLNSAKEERRALPSLLAEIYGPRADRTLLVLADDGVTYQTVMDAVDLIESAGTPDKERIRVRLVTPRAESGCPIAASGNPL